MRIWLKFIHQLDCFFYSSKPHFIGECISSRCFYLHFTKHENGFQHFHRFFTVYNGIFCCTCAYAMQMSCEMRPTCFHTLIDTGHFRINNNSWNCIARSSSCKTVNRIIAAKRFTGNSEYPILDSFHVNEHNGVNNRYFTLIAHACNLHALASSKLKREKHCSQTHFFSSLLF